MMTAEPTKEHKWLQRLVGNWNMESECIMAPDQPPSKHTGIEAVRTLGGVWVLCEGRGNMPDGSEAVTIMTLGYDPVKKRFVGTFIGSMMTHLWLYDGTWDEAANRLTLDTEGPSLTAEAKMIKYKDVIEFKSDDHRILSSHAMGEDGKYHTFMTAHYRRTK